MASALLLQRLPDSLDDLVVDILERGNHTLVVLECASNTKVKRTSADV